MLSITIFRLNLVLQKCSFNITKYLSHACAERSRSIIKVFEDFRSVRQIREEVEKIESRLAITANPNQGNNILFHKV